VTNALESREKGESRGLDLLIYLIYKKRRRKPKKGTVDHFWAQPDFRPPLDGDFGIFGINIA
jgi:hypothetical protein